ncbi:MAG: glycosyltransferase [Kiritimatiellae bacterium]|nr:glycosyltransferase [Kiritimatiellia bacterium]
MTITVGSGEKERVIHGHSLDIGEGGIRIIAPDLPKDETRIRMRFQIPAGVMPEEFVQGVLNISGEVRKHPESDSSVVGVQFEEPLPERLGRRVWPGLRWGAAAVLLLAVLFILAIKYENIYAFWFDVPVFFYSILVGGYLLTRFLFAAFYPKIESVPPDQLPKLSVVVPARNEEAAIERTVRHLMEGDYPADRLQVVIVDDASTDGTAAALVRARERYPETVVIRMSEALGKRHAMAAGVEVATGEIIAFVDSDSFVAPDALRMLVSRMLRRRVPAVTGHCEAENEWTNSLTRMQAVRYFVSFRVMKAAESLFGSVTCLSGPLAAYRRDVLEEVLPEWLNQKFLGQSATFGDDRGLTNALLRRGHDVEYEAQARCTTLVPEDHRTFLRQQMRWKRSWFRESLRAVAFMWRRPPFMAISFYLGFLLPILAPMIVLRALVYVPLAQRQTPLTYLAGVAIMSALISSVYLMLKRSRLWIYGVPFCFYYMFILVWQLPWAMVTCARRSWDTRS